MNPDQYIALLMEIADLKIANYNLAMENQTLKAQLEPKEAKDSFDGV